MKREIALILVCAMCLTVSACSKDNSTSNISKETSAVEIISEVSDENYIVPDLIGKTQEEAFEILHSVGLEGQVYFDIDSPDDNPIKSQDKEPGRKLSKGDVVGFYIGIKEDYFTYGSDDVNSQTESDVKTYYVPSKLEMYFDKNDLDVDSYTEIEWNFSDGRIGSVSELNNSELLDYYRIYSNYYSIEYDDGVISKLTSERDTTSYTHFYYDGQNRVCEQDNYLNNELDSKTYIEYSKSKRIIKNSNNDQVTTEYFDDNGNMISKEIYADRFSDGVANYEYEYDEYCNIIGHCDFDIYIKDIEYDEGKIISGTIYSDDWDDMNKAKVSYQYDYEHDFPSAIIIDSIVGKTTINIAYQEIPEEQYKSLLKISEDIELENFTILKIGESEWFPVECFYNFFKP